LPALRQNEIGSTVIAPQRIMDVGGGERGMAGCDRDLVKVRDDISDRIQSIHRGLLVRADLETTDIIVPRSKFFPKF
jgi:hypothetical protein